MFCPNWGNKLEENTIVCDKCGTLVKRSNYQKNVVKGNINIRGVVSLIFGIISILMCFDFLLQNISNVGMYTKITERLYYAFDLVLAPLCLSFVTLVVSYGGKNNDKVLNKIGLFLSIISIFMVVLEIVIVIIY